MQAEKEAQYAYDAAMQPHWQREIVRDIEAWAFDYRHAVEDMLAIANENADIIDPRAIYDVMDDDASHHASRSVEGFDLSNAAHDAAFSWWNNHRAVAADVCPNLEAFVRDRLETAA